MLSSACNKTSLSGAQEPVRAASRLARVGAGPCARWETRCRAGAGPSRHWYQHILTRCQSSADAGGGEAGAGPFPSRLRF